MNLKKRPYLFALLTLFLLFLPLNTGCPKRPPKPVVVRPPVERPVEKPPEKPVEVPPEKPPLVEKPAVEKPPLVKVEDPAETQFSLAKGLYDKREYGQAFFAFKKLTSDYPTSKYVEDAQYYIGSCYEKFDSYDNARETYQSILKNYPNSRWVPAALNGIGNSHLRQGKYQEALAAYQKVIDLYPSSEFVDNAHYGIGYYYFTQRKYPEAISKFQYVVTTFPKSSSAPAAQYGLGNTYRALGRTEEAIASHQKVIDNYPDSPQAKLARQEIPGLIYSRALENVMQKPKRIEEAKRGFQKIVDSYPDYHLLDHALYWLAECYYDEKRFKEAIAIFEEAIRNPNYDTRDVEYSKHDDAQLKIGYSYYNLREYDKAIQAFQKLIEQYPRSSYVGKAKEWILRIQKETGKR